MEEDLNFHQQSSGCSYTLFLFLTYIIVGAFALPSHRSLIPLSNPMSSLQLLCFTFLLPIIIIMSSDFLALAGAKHPSNETDRQALLAFKDQISKDPHNVLSSWNTSLHFCDWEGVSCGRRHGRVNSLNLSTLGLTGYISPHLANLSFLRFLTLPNNSFHGEIPQEIGRLFRLQGIDLQYNSLEGAVPASLSNCTQLRNIFLHSNRLLGEVPQQLGRLPMLTGLRLGRNNFTGVFPPFLANLSSLISLSLAYNKFHGLMPLEVGKLASLKTLLLGGNNFLGELPPTIYNLSNIEILVLHLNQLSGHFSTNMGYFFSKLQFVSVYSNQFTGTIPNSLCNASHLQLVDFSENQFVGSVPIDLGKLKDLSRVVFSSNELGSEKDNDLQFITSLTNCSKLETLNIQDNQLNGPLPPSIVNLSSNLVRLGLGGNPIYGGIPLGIENLINLRKLTFYENFLTGTIPDGIGKLSNLGMLSIFHNNLYGQIPTSIGNLSNLLELHLWQNHLEGSIPQSLGNCSGMQVLYLDDNHLDGSIPGQLFNLRSMLSLNLSRNSLTGNLPSEIGQLLNPYGLYLSHNKLSGEIPNALGKCTSLVELYLSHNSFVGTIPLEGLRAAQEIDISNNKLSGRIPTYFTEFAFLQLLNLSFNAFTGEVPEQGPFRNASIISVFGNSKLCGGILELHLPTCQTHGRNNIKNSFLLKVLLPLTVGAFFFTFASCILVYHRRKRPRNDQAPPSSMKEKHMNVSYAELFRATNRFSYANLIGSGSFGSVFKGTLDSYQMDIAVKVIRIEHTSLHSFTAECQALKRIRHRNIAKILTACSSLDFQGKEFKALVFKFMPNGNLESWLHPQADLDLYLNFRKRLDVAIDIAHALDYLHNHCESPVVHCDLKPNNILLDEDMVAHVSDFGLAKILSIESDDSSYTSMLKGSIGYIPPEYGTGYKVTTQGDVYSYGVLLMEMFMGKRPTDQMFQDGVNISKHAQMSMQERSVQVVDPRLLLKENTEDASKLQDCILSILKIGITCTSELPQGRINMSDVCTELEVVRKVYQEGMPRHLG